MSATYVVERVVGEPRDWDSKFGPMKSYTLALHGQSEVVELSQKPDRQPPSEGDEIEGEIVPSNGNFPPKLKRAKPQGGGNWSGGGMSPEREKKIVRQHSAEMALRYAQIRATQGKLPDDFSLEDLRKVIDWFDRDVEGAK